MKSSAIFERAGVREIGRSSFLGSDTFGRGVMSARTEELKAVFVVCMRHSECH